MTWEAQTPRCWEPQKLSCFWGMFLNHVRNDLSRVTTWGHVPRASWSSLRSLNNSLPGRSRYYLDMTREALIPLHSEPQKLSCSSGVNDVCKIRPVSDHSGHQNSEAWLSSGDTGHDLFCQRKELVSLYGNLWDNKTCVLFYIEDSTWRVYQIKARVTQFQGLTINDQRRRKSVI